MRACGAVDDRAFGAAGSGGVGPGTEHGACTVLGGKVFLNGVVGVGCAEVVLGEIDGLRGAVDETDGSVLPVTNVIAKADAQNGVSQVVRVEEEPESVDDAILFWHDNKDGWSAASSARSRTMDVATEISITFPEVTVGAFGRVDWIGTSASKRVTSFATVRIFLPAESINRAASTEFASLASETAVATTSTILSHAQVPR